MPSTEIPSAVREWLRSIFRACNERISEKLSNQPNAPEQSLDMTWIEHLSQYASPIVISSSWTIKIETHYLGGLRQFYGWEVADIGVLLFLKRGGALSRSKVALLQSKRLYPTNMQVEEESKGDYEVGIARLADPEGLGRSIATERLFEFTTACRYGAIIPGSDQVKAIEQYEKQNNLRVYYQLYHPWTIPFVQRIPLTAYSVPQGELSVGVRIVPARVMHAILSRGKQNRPSFEDLTTSSSVPMTLGWPLELFIADEFLDCREGDLFGGPDEARIQNLFYRRSGPISAAIAITIEGPEAIAT